MPRKKRFSPVKAIKKRLNERSARKDQAVVHEAMAMESHPGGAPTPPAFWHPAENLLLTFFFIAMMSLPLLDIVSRKLHMILIPGSLGLVQHIVLAIMMMGKSNRW